jgi:hypothetical protein
MRDERTLPSRTFPSAKALGYCHADLRPLTSDLRRFQRRSGSSQRRILSGQTLSRAGQTRHTSARPPANARQPHSLSA